jgi:hypothetical protein
MDPPMTTHALIILQNQLREEQQAYAKIAADEKATIDAGRRAQRIVDAQAEQVADLQRAINTLEAAEKADQVEVGDE